MEFEKIKQEAENEIRVEDRAEAIRLEKIKIRKEMKKKPLWQRLLPWKITITRR